MIGSDPSSLGEKFICTDVADNSPSVMVGAEGATVPEPMKLATTVQFCVTGSVVKELPSREPPHEPENSANLKPGSALALKVR